MSSANQPPNPFSREGSTPDDQSGANSSGNSAPWGSDSVPDPGPSASPAHESPWPGYPQSPEDTAPLMPPYGVSADSPYGATSYPPVPPYGADQPYSTGPVYGESPYEASPYQASFGSASPYGVTPYASPPMVQHPRAILALILGILGLAVCPFVGIAAMVVGSRARKEIDASPGRFAGRGMATAGLVLGIISMVFTVLLILIVVLGVAGAFGT